MVGFLPAKKWWSVLWRWKYRWAWEDQEEEEEEEDEGNPERVGSKVSRILSKNLGKINKDGRDSELEQSSSYADG